MDALALTFSSGWASGINAYLVVLVLGIGDRVGSFTEIPDALAARQPAEQWRRRPASYQARIRA